MDPVLYHAHHTLRSDDIPFWRDLAAENDGPVLELGCGTGRVLLRLARDDITVVGLDNDPEMLSFTRQSVPPTYQSRVEVQAADMRDFSLPGRYPLIILPCNTLSTFAAADRSRIFTAARRHLAPNGLFVFSIPNPLLLADLPAVGEVELEDEFTHPATGNPVKVYSSWQASPGRITFFWRYDHLYPDGRVVHAEHQTSHYLDPPQAYVAAVQASGLKPVAAYGDFMKERFTPESTYFVLAVRMGD